MTALPGPALTSAHDVRSERPTRREGSRARGDRPGEGEPSCGGVSAAPPRRSCPSPGQFGAEGAAPGRPSNILEGGAFSLRWEGEVGSISPLIGVSLLMDGSCCPKRAGAWREDVRPISTRFSLSPKSNSPPLETTPLPLSVSHWRISPSVFDEEGALNAAFTNPGPGKASVGRRIGQNIVPECTGSFHSVPFSRVVLLSL